ncbi:MAG: hypothetical protein LBD80_06360 [Tannerella sp.]|jgi:hypothetical protein|nr:hypothetical protein [Tannerella sp.]
MSANKIDISTVCEMFEKLSNKLDKQATDKSVEPIQVDLAAIKAMTERFEQVIEEVRKPAHVEYHHRHTIDITSSKVFLSLVIMVLVILGLSYAIGEQRKTINQYNNNDLKYRYIKMHGKADEKSIYRLERQLRYGDSIKIIRSQVEQYEELLREQAERIERAKANDKEMNELQRKVENAKGK